MRSRLLLVLFQQSMRFPCFWSGSHSGDRVPLSKLSTVLQCINCVKGLYALLTLTELQINTAVQKNDRPADCSCALQRAIAGTNGLRPAQNNCASLLQPIHRASMLMEHVASSQSTAYFTELLTCGNLFTAIHLALCCDCIPWKTRQTQWVVRQAALMSILLLIFRHIQCILTIDWFAVSLPTHILCMHLGVCVSIKTMYSQFLPETQYIN